MLQQQLQTKINNKTKPIGALGKLEDIALQIGSIQQSTTPNIKQPTIIVFAADHGIATTGLVNPYPQAVTAQMVMNFLQGGAAINVFTKQHAIQLQVVDCGVNYMFNETLYNTSFINKKIALGTDNYSIRPAMLVEQAIAAIENGKNIIKQLTTTCNTVGFGEMGISNTSSASLIMHAITQKSIVECVGRGTGANDEQLAIKIKTLQQVANLHAIETLHNNPLELLATIGGFEIATMVGAYIEAAANKMVIVVDGFIATAALLVAQQLESTVLHHCIFAHASGEKGHAAMLHYLKVQPILQLGMRLGEGTGAALAIPLLQSATLFVQEMASFQSANVSTANA